MAVSGEVGTVELTIQAANTAFFSGTASAFADPHIFVDPSFAGAGNYSVLLSDNVGNGLRPVPEPGTLMLLVVGLLSLAAVRQRRRWKFSAGRYTESRTCERRPSWGLYRSLGADVTRTVDAVGKSA
jgi:hypothetical protein